MKTKASIFVFATILAACSEASAQVGKRVSMMAPNTSAITATFPATTDHLLTLPSGYKSKANTLKVTATYQVSCSGVDAHSSRLEVDSQIPFDMLFPYETPSSVANHMVTKVYFLPSEKLGGPAITPGSDIKLQLTSSSGQCGVSNLRMIAEALK